MISYEEPLFRPPSEAYSLILQLTIGCSWNKCSFCEMYSDKKFRVRDKEVIKDIDKVAPLVSNVRKVFLADGDALVLSFAKLLPVLQHIQKTFPKLTRIASYASPKNILSKSEEELKELRMAGLKLLYIGIESGDDAVLECVNKGESSDAIVAAVNRAKNAGMKVSVMIISGLGGKHYSQQHALGSAAVVNAIQPHFLSLLVLSAPYGEAVYQQKFKGDYQPMSAHEQIEEMRLFIEHTHLEGTIFRSNHVSNYVNLEGVLGKDKKKLLDNIDQAIANGWFSDYPRTFL